VEEGKIKEVIVICHSERSEASFRISYFEMRRLAQNDYATLLTATWP